MNRKIFAISVGVVVLDQVVKAIVAGFMTLNQSVVVINNFFNLTYYNNYGAAWGIFNNQTYFIIVVTLLALILIYRYMYLFVMNKRNLIAFGLLTGGILGNLIDRVLLGYVVDFFDFNILGYNFPIFNIGDIAIVLGVFLLIIAIFKGEDRIGAKNNSKSK